MGCGGRVWGRIHIGDAARLSSMEELRATRGQQRVKAAELPYRARTYLWPLSGLYILPESVPFHSRPGPVTCSTADTCAGCAPGVRTCCCWPFSVRRCLRLQRTPPSAIPLSTCSSSVSCACHGVHRSRGWLGGSCHGGRTRLPSQLDETERSVEAARSDSFASAGKRPHRCCLQCLFGFLAVTSLFVLLVYFD